MSNKFQDAQNKLIIQATRVAGNYLLSHYGSTHLIGEPKVELTSTVNPVTSAFEFNGKITCFATPGLLNQVGINMTVNSNDIEVESETIQADITEALNAQAEHDDIVVASLNGFKLTDTGSKYLKVSHSDLQDTNLGLVGKNEYATSHNKSELLQSIVKDAMLETPISFTGEFKEPTVEKLASDWLEDIKCEDCKAVSSGHDRKHYCEKCCGTKSEKNASLNKIALDINVIKNLFQDIDPAYAKLLAGVCMTPEEAIQKGISAGLKLQVKKSSWLTADLLDDNGPSDEDVQQKAYEMFHSHWDALSSEEMDQVYEALGHKVASVGIKEDMPMARAADHLAQSAQLEEQSGLAAQAKVEHEAANALMALLQGMGYGSAKIVESSRSNDGLDFMAAIDDAGSVKAVSIPVIIKDAKVVLPKKSLISTLVSKGLDVKAKLAEQFDLEALEKLAAIEEKIAYEANEVVSILNENRPVEKVAAGEKQPFFDSDDSTMTVNKHLLPNHEDYKVGDKLSDGTDEYEIVNTDGQQNDKNEGSSSQWTLKKCQAPERGDKEPKNTIPS